MIIYHFKPEVLFMQVDDGFMLDEVFDEHSENISESSARATQTNNWQTKDGNKQRKHG